MFGAEKGSLESNRGRMRGCGAFVRWVLAPESIFTLRKLAIELIVKIISVCQNNDRRAI